MWGALRKFGNLIREHKVRTAIAIIGMVIFASVLTGNYVYGKLQGYYNQSNYVASVPTPTALPGITKPPKPTEEPVDEEMRKIHEQMDKYSKDEPITTAGNVYNILLVGIDKVKVKKDNGANSDSMILISLNYETKKMNMISLMRDMYVSIPRIGHRKLNAAYANGGAPLLMETIQENLRIQVDRYIVVSFGDMVNIVDEIGKIHITFTDDEARSANETITSMCEKMGLEDKIEEYTFDKGGTYECNGIQAVAYARIRKVGNADYERTERQREVLSKLLSKLKQMRIDDLDRLANKLLPSITHNIPEDEYWGLVVKAPSLLGYEIKQDRIPYDNMFQGNYGSLVPVWDKTIAKLKETIYGTTNAMPTSITPTPKMH